MSSLVMAIHDIKPNRIEVGKYYPAKVIENNDLKKHPDKKALGRIKFRIPVLFDDIDDELLPWAMPQFFRYKGGKNNGSFSVPKKEAKVMIRFQTPDVYNGFYESYPYTIKEQLELLTKEVVDKDEYPKKHVIYCFDNGNLFWLNDDYKDEELKNKLYIKNVGNVQFWFGKNFDQYVKDNYKLEVDGKFTVIANKDHYKHEVLVPHFFTAKQESTRVFEGRELKTVFGDSYHTFAGKAERQQGNGLLYDIGNGDYLLRIRNGNIQILCSGDANIVVENNANIHGTNVLVQAEDTLKLVGSRITKSVELEFEDGETTMDKVKEMVEGMLDDYAAQNGGNNGGF